MSSKIKKVVIVVRQVRVAHNWKELHWTCQFGENSSYSGRYEITGNGCATHNLAAVKDISAGVERLVGVAKAFPGVGKSTKIVIKRQANQKSPTKKL